MRIIALMNQKGGVGKTTTTANLGAALAEAGKRVCLIDLDPQSHLTINYGIELPADALSLYDMLIEDKSFAQTVVKLSDRISVIPSSIDLAGAEVELVSMLGRETILRKRLEGVQQDYDYILMDCPPSLGLLTLNALSVADEVIIPMQPHFLALQGVGKLLETVALVSRRMNPKLKVSGIVLTMFDAHTKLTIEVVNDLNAFIEAAKGKPLPWASAKVFDTKIRRNIKLAECPSFGQTIIQYEPMSNGAADYRALAKEIDAMTPPIPAAATVAPEVTRIAVSPPVKIAPPVAPQPLQAPVAKITPPASAPVKPSAPVAPPVPTRPVKVAVTVNPAIDPSKLAAAKNSVPPPLPSPKRPADSEVAA